MNNIEALKVWVYLLEQEVEALRSVLSEWDQDKSCYLQMSKADAIDAVLNSLVRPV